MDADNITGSSLAANISYDEATFPPCATNIPLYLIIYIILTTCALGGNAIIILAITFNPTMRSTVFLLLLGLSISDFLFALISPLHLRSLLYPGTWDLMSLGDAGCKAYYFLFRALYAFSVLTLVVIALDRLWIMRLTGARKQIEGVRLKRGIFLLVILSGCFSSPLLFKVGLDKYDENSGACRILNWENWIKVYFALVYSVLYIFPLITLTVVYSIIWKIVRADCETTTLQQRAARRKKIANMLTLIVISFFLNWTPYSIVEAILMFKYPWSPDSCFISAINYSMLAVYASGALNPFLYGCFSQEVRNSIRNLFIRGHG